MNKTLTFALVALAGLVSSFAHADTQLLERHGFAYNYAGTNFRFDAEHGTAWMEVNLTEDLGMPPVDADPTGHGHPIEHSIIRHKVDVVGVKGLSYDAAAAQIVYTTTAKIVCATVTEKHGFFGNKWMINLTGACRTYQVREGSSMAVYFEAK